MKKTVSQNQNPALKGAPSEPQTQSPAAIQGVKLLVSVYPSIPFLIGTGLLFFYVINKKMEVRIESDLKQKRNG